MPCSCGHFESKFLHISFLKPHNSNPQNPQSKALDLGEMSATKKKKKKAKQKQTQIDSGGAERNPQAQMARLIKPTQTQYLRIVLNEISAAPR